MPGAPSCRRDWHLCQRYAGSSQGYAGSAQGRGSLPNSSECSAKFCQTLPLCWRTSSKSALWPCRHGQGVALRQETDVLDTWFSSGLWPFSTLGWPDEDIPGSAAILPDHCHGDWARHPVLLGMPFKRPKASGPRLHLLTGISPRQRRWDVIGSMH